MDTESSDTTGNGLVKEEKIVKGEDTEEPMSLVDDVSTEYFASYEDLNVHRLMLQDTARTNAYQTAISDATALFKDKIVMDVGAGTGILSLFCAKAGAKKVYAVEASGLAKTLPEVFSKNGFADVVTVIHSRVEDIESLPSNDKNTVDIIVSEWMGFYLLHESMLESVLYARDKFLISGGLMFPNSAQIYAAPCQIPDLWKNHGDFWTSQSHYGFDLSPFGNIAKNLQTPVIETIASDGLLSDPQLLFDLNLQTVPSNSLEVFKDRRFFTMDQTGDMHAVCLWFTCTFPVVPGKEPVELSTAPWSEETHWKQTLIMLPDKLDFEEGDITGWEISLEKASLDKGSRSYRIHYQCLGDDDEHPVPCECGAVKCEIIKHYMTQSNEANNVDVDE
ncbi:Protein arginine N-methyltransferase 1 [Orchesella cincta]|uniref:type I protein arginine methyltransferase n=1 Tax=Orchesella cincta TaxID=48709 RepID=A0A1D2ND28_ORCCI|nr:Protein arginine N-methyltransferase 1 [Orchesella cincta]